MPLSKSLLKLLPVLNRPQNCPACGEAFACEISLGGCWCTSVKVSASTLKALRDQYNGCLCRSCLEKAEAKHAEG
ncbi:MAG TPA: cysteine-rich CWC family protein [Pyrinomonadaceae bacterium]|nr:cysteine-rich CWC family protein [Pyrinomonadaceae bacterium]